MGFASRAIDRGFTTGVGLKMRPLEWIHQTYVHHRRVRVLSERVSELIPYPARVLDVGCGDGLLASHLSAIRPDIHVHGVDVLIHDRTFVPVTRYDGQTLPYSDDSFDVVTLIDVLHHTTDPVSHLAEAKRVARRAIVVKDHLREGFLAGRTLRLMDRVGNERFGVSLPFNYWERSRWWARFKQLGLVVEAYTERLGLYPWPASLLFGRSLHFATRLSTENDSPASRFDISTSWLPLVSKGLAMRPHHLLV